MDFKELLVSIQKSAGTLADGWIAKTAISAVLATGSVHGSALGAFVMLVFVDLLTRWIARCYKHLQDSGKSDEQLNLVCCLVDIPEAFKDGYINSSAMKHRFAGKILLYGLLTIMAVNVDNMVLAAGESQVMLRMVWIYLAATEAMSILENLREAGVEQAGDLLQFVKGRLGVLFDRNKSK